MGQLSAIAVAAVFGAAFAAPWLHRRLGDRCGILLGLIPLAAAFLYASMIPLVSAGGVVEFRREWVPSLGLALDLRIDGLSLLFLLLISGIGVFVTWYAAGYLHGKKDLGRFYLYLFGFMGSMLGVVSSDHLVAMFVFWELTSISSYLLIGYYHTAPRSRASALQALLVTGTGGLAMLAGMLLLGRMAGTFRISELNALDAVRLVSEPGFPVVLVLILLGAFTKSAQFPFHFWLPNAMEAPAPVSSYLHSATMVKAGVFLLARLHPLLSASPLWIPIVAPVGAVTMMIGVVMGLGQRDLKKILAYSTLAVLGTLTMLLGIGTEAAVKAAMVYLLAHALYKAALFMCAGSIDHETGTRDPDAVGGLRRAMPFTAAAALLAGLSMAGFPALLGFVGKEYFYKALLDTQGLGILWEVLGVSASVVMFALASTAAWKPFAGPMRPTPKHPHEAPWTMWIGPILLSLAGLAAGLFPGFAGGMLIAPSVHAVLGSNEQEIVYKFWHGWTVALGLSALTMALGVAVYLAAPRIRAASGRFAILGRLGPERGYELILSGTLEFAGRLTSFLQNGYLRNYLITVLFFTSALLLWTLPTDIQMPSTGDLLPIRFLPVVVCLMIVVAAIAACLTLSRFYAILALGVVGFGVGMLYFLFSAPDLAMTQVLVETLAMVLFVLAFYRLPVFANLSKPANKLRDALIATGFGTVMTLVILFALGAGTADKSVSAFMGESSLPHAFGRNVVNVILVDFRALDTFGEITVLAIAALGVWAIMRLRPKNPEKGGDK
jgi:multicomponent Na+:H+ antiporter subunit A